MRQAALPAVVPQQAPATPLLVACRLCGHVAPEDQMHRCGVARCAECGSRYTARVEPGGRR